MKKGFTLIELLVVVLIIGILAAIALPQYTTAVEKSRAAEALSLMGTIRYAGERYRLQTNAFPNKDMSVLDIEVPNVSTTDSVSTAYTKNYCISTANSGTSYVITAARGTVANNACTANTGTGDLVYSLTTTVGADGSVSRACTPDTGKICKALNIGSL